MSGVSFAWKREDLGRTKKLSLIFLNSNLTEGGHIFVAPENRTEAKGQGDKEAEFEFSMERCSFFYGNK